MKVTVKEPNGKQIKPVHGVGQPPFLGMDFSYIHYLSDAGIPFSRLHDLASHFNGIVDIPFIFRDFNADPDDPDAYDFIFTDELMKALDSYGVEPFFRLGVSIENYRKIKAYYIDPPSDNLKWSKICEHIIMHYNEGWANGFHFNIRYWEIWNEPENFKDPAANQMWNGDMQDYFDLYETSSKYLKKKFPHLKIGGYASCGFYSLYTKDDGSHPYYNDLVYYTEFFNEFLKMCREKNCPLDFFSWHNYNGAKEIKICAEYARRRLDEEGFVNTETSFNEWHCNPGTRGTARHAAENTAILLALQDLPVDTAMFYDARIGTSIYGGLFNPLTREPFRLYYGFKAFNELYKRKNQLEVEVSGDGVYAVAAKNENDGCVVIANTNCDSLPLDLNVTPKSVREISEKSTYEETEFNGVIKPHSVVEIKF